MTEKETIIKVTDSVYANSGEKPVKRQTMTGDAFERLCYLRL